MTKLINKIGILGGENMKIGRITGITFKSEPPKVEEQKKPTEEQPKLKEQPQADTFEKSTEMTPQEKLKAEKEANEKKMQELINKPQAYTK